MRVTLGVVGTVLLACTLSTPAVAQTWPAQPVRLVVPFAPGGGVDFVARLLSPKYVEQTGRPFVVDNRPGAAGTAGSALVAKATPNGYTLLLSPPEMAIDPNLRANLPYHPLKDFAPISQLTSGQFMLASGMSVPVKTVKDVIALANAQPGKLHYGSSGTGSINHLKGELLQIMTGINWVHVPFKGAGPAIIAMIGGEIPFVWASTAALVGHVQSGKARAIGVTGLKRFAALPDVPTIAESGVPGYEVIGWYGMYAPAGTPPDVIRRIYAETARALNDASVKEKLAASGNEPVGSSPQEFGQFLRAEIDKWANVVKASGLPKID